MRVKMSVDISARKVMCMWHLLLFSLTFLEREVFTRCLTLGLE